jgi:hypothetical protein
VRSVGSLRCRAAPAGVRWPRGGGRRACRRASLNPDSRAPSRSHGRSAHGGRRRAQARICRLYIIFVPVTPYFYFVLARCGVRRAARRGFSLHARHRTPTRHISHESLPTCHVGVTSQFSHECAPRRHRFSKLACTSMLWRGQAHTTNRQSALKSLYGTFGLVMTLTAMTLHHIHKTRANACLQNLYAIRICLAAAEAFWSSLLHMWRRRLVAE